MKGFLEADDFRSADVKKIGANLYRARLDRSNRLLFSIYRYQDQAYVLVLECIAHHAYDKSRFLRRGATIDESKIPIMDHAGPGRTRATGVSESAAAHLPSAQ